MKYTFFAVSGLLVVVAIGFLSILFFKPESTALTANVSSSTEAPVSTIFIKKSDVPLSPRLFRPDWQEAFDAFKANTILWTYSGSTYIDTVSQQIPVQCALPTRLESQNLPGACITRAGVPVAPYGSTEPTGDVNSPEYREYILNKAKGQVNWGCRMLHQDEAAMNVHHAEYFGGCFGDESMEGFRNYLNQNLSSTELTNLGIQDITTFNYRTQDIPALKSRFIDFQKESVIEFQNWLHASLREYAKNPVMEIYSADPALSFSANLPQDSSSAWLAPSYDFFISELYTDRTKALADLRASATWARSQFSKPSAITVGSSDVWLNQKVIASSYALGMPVIAPWDVYVYNKDNPVSAPRFYGNSADFSPLYSMIRSNQTVFDSCTFLADSGTANGTISSLPEQSVPTTTSTYDGAVTSVQASSTTAIGNFTIVYWSKQNDPKFKTILLGTKVSVGTTTYTTVSNTLAGNIYIPANSPVKIGDRVKINLTSQAGVDGFITKVDKAMFPNRTTLFWSNQTDAKYKNIPYGTTVKVGAKTYTTTSNTTTGNIYLPADAVVNVGDIIAFVATTNPTGAVSLSPSGKNYVAVTKLDTDPAKRAVHIINWDTTTSPASTLSLKASAFTAPPTRIVTSKNPTGTTTPYLFIGGYYTYKLDPIETWAFLY